MRRLLLAAVAFSAACDRSGGLPAVHRSGVAADLSERRLEIGLFLWSGENPKQKIDPAGWSLTTTGDRNEKLTISSLSKGCTADLLRYLVRWNAFGTLMKDAGFEVFQCGYGSDINIAPPWVVDPP